MECYVVGDVTIPGWGLHNLDLAYEEAAVQALSGDVIIYKMDGDKVVKEIPVDQVAPKPPRKGRVNVPKKYRKNFGALHH